MFRMQRLSGPKGQWRHVGLGFRLEPRWDLGGALRVSKRRSWGLEVSWRTDERTASQLWEQLCEQVVR